MPRYRRDTPGGTYFFTVNTYRRQPFLIDGDVRAALREGILLARATRTFVIRRRDLLTRHIDLLRDSVRRIRRLHPFQDL